MFDPQVTYISEKIKTDIDAAIAQNKFIKIRVHAMFASAEYAIWYITRAILGKFGSHGLTDTAYSSIKEMAINGTKANIKQLFFEDSELSMTDASDYEKGMAIFRQSLNPKWISKYGFRSIEKVVYVDILFRYDKDQLMIDTVNNSPISEGEETRIRHKFEDALRYDSLADFYANAGDESEGAGMGIAMIIMLLKHHKIDPKYFTITSDHEKNTVARILFPLSDKPANQKNMQSEAGSISADGVNTSLLNLLEINETEHPDNWVIIQ